jgi:hypothetical protein
MAQLPLGPVCDEASSPFIERTPGCKMKRWERSVGIKIFWFVLMYSRRLHHHVFIRTAAAF